MNWLRTSIHVLKKDLTIEFRTRYAINTVLAFVAASLLLLLFTLRAQNLDPTPKSGLIWIIILFAALSILARSFVAETDRNTYNLLRIYGSGTSVFVGKLIFNGLFTLFINVTTFVIYIFLLDIIIIDIWAFLLVILFGTLGLSSVSTMLAAIVSQADRKGVIFSVLSIPLLIPFLLILTRVTKIAFVDGSISTSLNDVFSMVGFAGVTITAGVLLFEYIWEE